MVRGSDPVAPRAEPGLDPLAELASRVERLEVRAAVQEVIARYCMRLDDRDLGGLEELFTPDVRFRRRDGTWASGRDELMRYFLDHLTAMGPTLHLPYANLIIEVHGSDTASSVHYGGAEHAVDDELVLAANTYHHEYRLDGETWRISRRVVDQWYFCRAADLIEHYGTRAQHWWDGPPSPDRMPETSATWKAFVADHLSHDPTAV